MVLQTLMFDLDGTLLPLNQDVFLKGYFKALIPHIAHLVEPDKIAGQILQATEEMVANEDPQLTNMEAFQRSFVRLTGIPIDSIWPVFDRFYEEAFAELQHLTSPSDIAREICRTAVEKGYKLVLATNPIFPESAIRHRMRWAGIDGIPFALVTSMEHMHYCKPSPKYFLEILDLVDSQPFESIMIGNDAQEDGVAGKLGMQTFLVKDFLIDRGLGHVDFSHEGTLADVLTFVQDLPRAT
ncbi:HAD family hydrolase [Alicyclobacillus tolerans]|uniref:HAD family hydrolase n=1 Tax=Alicyclobacillus tolerans TaxID=90970 RepID=UPI001F3819B7|nr:HAD family hydrolase [Alicyclobacillus tolerans]MCF8563890.1 HAD family hydrolase [Alicyclobacillus tolerans]